MSFVAELNALPVEQLVGRSLQTTKSAAGDSLNQGRLALDDFVRLISPAAGELLESMCRRAHTLTRQRFGKVMRLFAPLYISNECVNACEYCGFSQPNPIQRVTLSLAEVEREAQALKAQGFRSLLLVSGEHPKYITASLMLECIRLLHRHFPSLALEIGLQETDAYREMVSAGAEGLVVYQETYDRKAYAEVHLSGPKRHFDWRLEAPERAYAAGFHRLGIGALYGLADWRHEAIALAAHACFLLKHCWQSQLTISLPRLRPHAGSYHPKTTISDRELAQLTAALRLFLPDVGLVLSTRESPPLRDGLIRLGITSMSAGSHTEPGGYTGAGREKVHLTERGRIKRLSDGGVETPNGEPTPATVQFQIADHRSPRQIADRLRQMDYEPVWKDWDAELTA